MPHRPTLIAISMSLLLSASILAQEGHESQGNAPEPGGHDHGAGHGEHHAHGTHGEHKPDHGHGDLHAAGHQHDFSDVERWSAIFDAPERHEWQRPEEVVELMALESGMHVADLGAGTGYFLPHLAAAVGPKGQVYGLDIEESLVAHMNERATEAQLSHVEARVIPTDSPGMPDGSLDRLLIVNTWHHLDDRPSYARRIGRALKEGGQLIIVDFTRDSPTGPPKEHRLPPKRVIAELEAGGLEARVAEETLPRQYVIIAHVP